MGEFPLIVDVGKKIRTIRKERGLSQEALAHTLGFDRSYLGRIECADTNFSVSRLLEICIALKCSPKVLLPSYYEIVNFESE